MKILFFHRWVGVHKGGAETHLLNLAQGFCNLGHEVTILTRQGQMLYDLDKRIKVIRISKNYGESDHSYADFRVYLHTFLFMLKSLTKLFGLKFKGKKFDLISVHFATEAIVARIFRFFVGIPYIFILEGYTPLEAMTARHADRRIAISHYEASVYKQRHHLEAEVIYIGVEPNRFLVEREAIEKLRAQFVAADEFLVLTVCRLEPRKDISTLLAAAKMVNQKNSRIKFLIVGDGISRQELTDFIKKNNLNTFVKLVGYVSDAELSIYYRAADLFVLSSKEEWFGIVFLEAMASGLPIISTEVDACPEIISDTGVFFAKGDYPGLSEKILTLIEHPELRKELSQKALTRSRKFSWDKQILLYEKAYQGILERRKDV